ncbi:MAG: ATP-grasp domain-containing protein [Deltaproteobacteria bacterium]|nr:ATP-grasp domain-containing protein [Deltaproteobacteria bacterium]
MRWVLEFDVFGDNERRLAEAARRAGHEVTSWTERRRVNLDDEQHVIFHGSLNVAATIGATYPAWRPGAFCDVEALRWSSWEASARPWLLNAEVAVTTVRTAATVAKTVGTQMVFVRPDSVLKPFSGRVLDAGEVTPETLDFGFYFDDLDLPVVIAPAVEIAAEWRFVVVDREVVAGSAYDAGTRSGDGEVTRDHAAWRFAADVADALPPPERVYVLDACSLPSGDLHLLELNAFSGADLYDCDPDAIVRHVGQ